MGNEKNNTEAQARRVMKLAWVMFLIISLAGFFTQFHRTSSGVIRGDLAADFEMGATAFSLFSSMYFYPYVIMQLPYGIMCDKWGVRKTVSLATIIAAIGTAIFAAAPNFSILCLGRALVGVGVAAPVVATQKLTASWFKQGQIVTVGGFGSLIGMLGGICAQAPLALVVAAFTWRATFYGLAVLTVAMALICIFFLKDSPESIGLPSIKELEGNAASAEQKAEPVAEEEQKSVIQVLKGVFTNRYCWSLFIMAPIMQGAYIVFSGTWGVSYLMDTFGYDSIKASTLTAYVAIGMSISNFAIALISDMLKSRKKPLVFIAALTFAEWFLLAYGQGFLAKIGFAGQGVVMFLFGCTAAAVPMLFAVCREVNDRRYVGMSISTVNTIGMLSAAFMPVIVGAVIDNNMKTLSGGALYTKSFGFIVILAGIALVASIFSKETHAKYVEPKYGKTKKEGKE